MTLKSESTIASKWIRYQNLFNRVSNWKYYLFRKVIGFNTFFDFQVKDFGLIRVNSNMFAPFKENFFDDIYFKHIPHSIFENRKQPVIIDIGANVGFFSLAAFLKFPHSKVYAFEPHPFCYKTLSEYKEAYDRYNWTTYRQAVSDQNGKISLNVSSVDEFTTVSSIFESKSKGEKLQVPSIRLDSFIEEVGVDRIDFIKLDCEGAEYSIVYSFPDDVFSKIHSFCIETHRGNEQNQNISFLSHYIEKKGFKTIVSDKGYTGYIWAWRPPLV